MKKILLLIPYGSVGGMERLALYFYNYYKKLGYTVKGLKLIKLSDDIISFGDDELFLSEIDLSSMSTSKRVLFYLKVPLKINKIVKRFQITHSISFGDMTNLFSSLSFTNEYKIASIHALKSVEFINPSPLNKIFNLSYKTSYFFLDKVVCISEAIKIDLIENCGFKFKNKLEVIYNPHDIKSIIKLGNEPIIDNYEVQLFQNQVILFIGRISMQKAPWHLLNAFIKLKNEFPGLKLVFLGDGQIELINYLKKIIKNKNIEDQVVFLGRKSNPFKYLKKSKLMVLSSYYEGTPNVIVEAMALNIPIVTTNCTAGIGELMGLSSFEKDDNKILKTNVGFITPTVFKGFLDIPKDDKLSNEDVLLSKAMSEILSGEIFYDNKELVNQLLTKFKLKLVAKQYLKPTTTKRD